jgi:hypothetical protein
MLSIYVSKKDSRIIAADKSEHEVRFSYVPKDEGLVFLQDIEPDSTFEDVTIKLCKKFYNKDVVLSQEIRTAILKFMLEYHAKIDLSFDCYDFVCMYKGIKKHNKMHLLDYWNVSKIPMWVPVGSVVFFNNLDSSYFHHAAIYIGRGIYLSVYGAGGDLEFSTLKSMKRSFGAKSIVLGSPI